MRGLALLALLAPLSVAGCSRQEGARPRDLAAVEAVIQQLPECPAGGSTLVDLEAAGHPPLASYLGKPVSVRGRLQRSGWSCYMMGCGAATDWLGRAYQPCCNGCGSYWLVGGKHRRGSQPPSYVFLQLAGSQEPMRLGATDCSTSAIETRYPPAEVLAAGTLQTASEVQVQERGYLLADARLCVVSKWWLRMELAAGRLKSFF